MKSPLNISWKTEIIPLTIIVAGFLTSALSFNKLPQQVISHWNFLGNPDGWMNKTTHSIIFPLILLALYLLLLFVPSMDPRKERYKEFSNVYNGFRSLISLVLYLVFLIATLVNLGYEINVGKVIPLIIGLLMIVIGNYMGKIKKNWFVGIRTPWTLSSENVWNKTHRLGGWMFVAFGMSLIITPYLKPMLALSVFVIGVCLATLVPIAYSYVLYKREK